LHDPLPEQGAACGKPATPNDVLFSATCRVDALAPRNYFFGLAACPFFSQPRPFFLADATDLSTALLLAVSPFFPWCCPAGTVLRGQSGYKRITEWEPREGYCEETFSGCRHFSNYGGFGFRGGHAVEGAASGFGL
jgi:hypothetical protein